jgi:quercetin dioxygenase-like cupin family protein
MKSRVALVLAVAVLAGGASFAFAAGPSITGGVVASGVLTDKNTTVSLSRTSGFVMEWAKVPPGASFGWHFHRRPVAVAITAGTLTLYDATDPSCKASRFSAGQGFVEPADHVHVARNEGTKPVSLYAIYLGVPGTWRKNPTPLDAYVKSPRNCPADIR